MRYCYCEAKVRSSSVSICSTFAHADIFEGSPLKEDPPLIVIVNNILTRMHSLLTGVRKSIGC